MTARSRLQWLSSREMEREFLERFLRRRTLPPNWLPHHAPPDYKWSTTPLTDLEKTLAERGDRYGDFTGHAQIAQDLMAVMRGAIPRPMDARKLEHGAGWNRLSAVQAQALTVIADKIARILNGDPNYKDNWHDIGGYAKLAEDRCAGPIPPLRDMNGEVIDKLRVSAQTSFDERHPER